MATLWLVLLVVLLGFVLLEGVLLFGILRQLGTLYVRLDTLGAASSRAPQGLDLGTQAPKFKLPRVGGGEVSLETYRSRPVLLAFLSPGCGPCEKLLPALNALLDRPDLASLQILLISQGAMAANEDYQERHEIRPPLIVQAGHEVMDAYQVRGTPFVVGIDAGGVIRRQGVANTGEQLDQLLPHDEPEIVGPATLSPKKQAFGWAFRRSVAATEGRQIEG